MQYVLWREYLLAVERAGGIPVVLPATDDPTLVKQQLALVSALVLIGGQDYSPRIYRAKQHPKVDLIHPVRERFDVLLAKEAIKRKIPMLGICGGLQVVNIALGGTLEQHVPDIVGHKNHSKKPHSVNLCEKSVLKSLMGAKKIKVNSYHHQAVKDVGRGLRVAARSTDGIVEAIEDGKRILCVQWHPEMLQDKTAHRTIFKWLVNAAQK